MNLLENTSCITHISFKIFIRGVATIIESKGGATLGKFLPFCYLFLLRAGQNEQQMTNLQLIFYCLGNWKATVVVDLLEVFDTVLLVKELDRPLTGTNYVCQGVLVF